MAGEKFANLAETTLSAGYTSGTTTLSVNSATGFPTTGPFRVRLGNTGKTIWRVDSVSGTTFTGAAEEFDANANSGDSVTVVLTKVSTERLLQSPDASDLMVLSGAAAVDEYFGLQKMKRLDQSAWSWVNQGGASVTQQGGVVFFQAPGGVGATNLRVRVKSHSAPKTYEMAVVTLFEQAAAASKLQDIGFVFRESGTGKIQLMCASNFTIATGNPPAAFCTANFTNATTFSANVATVVTTDPIRPQGLFGKLIWLRATDDNTNLKFEYSYDHQTWVQVSSAGRTAFMAGGPDQIGVSIVNQSGTTIGGGWILSWIET